MPKVKTHPKPKAPVIRVKVEGFKTAKVRPKKLKT